MRRTTALCLLALSAMAAPPAAAEQQPAEQKPTEQRAARQPATEQQAAREQAANERAAIEVLIVEHTKTHGLPAALVRLVIRRESNFNPRAAYRGNYGLMQIRLGTARALGYRGTAEGLLDPATNMTYGVSYLAGAYRAARGDEARTLVLYSRGYHDVH
jgi:soluble lytic murein transglycosylase-like protein